ncbi:MAG: DNA primase [Alphaproteobacteria bacterium]
MARSIPDSFVDRIRRDTDLVALISEHVALERRGNGTLWAISPFAPAEKTPSFEIRPDRNDWHCFSTNRHGDAIDWLQENKGMNFPEAVSFLADRLGVEMPTVDGGKGRAGKGGSAVGKAQTERLAKARAAAGWAAERYAAALASDSGAEARTYLSDRGLGAVAIAAFSLGFAPQGDTLLKDAKAAGHSPTALLDAGLALKRRKTGQTTPLFMDRIVFPIRDTAGRVIGFGGRDVTGNAERKYLNSPACLLFDKTKALFGIDKLRRCERIAAVEGFLDVIAYWEAGIPAVAPMGIALNADHLAMIWRYCKAPVLTFDGDDAGRRSTRSAIEKAMPLLTPQRRLLIADLPDGTDPDSLVRSAGGTEGAAAARELHETARPLSAWLIDPIRNAVEAEDLVDALDQAQRMLEATKDPVWRQALETALSKALLPDGGHKQPGRNRPDNPAATPVDTLLRRRRLEDLALRILASLEEASPGEAHALQGIVPWSADAAAVAEAIAAGQGTDSSVIDGILGSVPSLPTDVAGLASLLRKVADGLTAL